MKVLKLMVVCLVTGLTACVTRPGHIEVTYNLYPVNDAASAVGALQANGPAGTNLAQFSVTLPSGEIIKGESSTIRNDAFALSGIYASVFALDEPTSIAPDIHQSMINRITPTKYAQGLITTGFGDQGTRMECEGYWHTRSLTGLGGCQLSDGSLYRYHSRGQRVR
ncbi:MAG: hypothetical protein OER96_07265 [Gammaproteobacteria bacterium]|nr:hypothetical protein [Gammaproteobacteria bacterium]